MKSLKYLITAFVALSILVIFGIGQVSHADASTSNVNVQANAKLNAAATIVPAPTQTPQSDGTIIHTVRTGETIESIAAAYNVTVKHIRDYNNIPTGSVSPGKHLLISIASPTPQPANATFVVVTSTNTPNPSAVQFVIVTSTNTPNPSTPPPSATTVLPTATATTAATQTATPIPATVAPSATMVAIITSGSLCVTGYEDKNTNHWMDNNESRLPGMRISLAPSSGAAQDLTTTADSATCLKNLVAGSYVVTTTAPDGYGLTTPAQLNVDLTAGAQVSLSFGAAQGFTPPASGTADAAATAKITSTPTASGGILHMVTQNSGLIILAVAALILVGGIGVALLIRRL